MHTSEPSSADTQQQRWEVVIGLEIHAQLATRSKMFSGAPTAYGAEPNTQACHIDLGLPGVLPVVNREAVVMAIMFGLAVEAKIARRSIFARKNYYYPDLPKGYQISQYELPIVGHGAIEIETPTGAKTIGVTRAHLEEDAGKSLHENLGDLTGIDLNRAGTPLLEIVSDPDMRSAEEAVAYLRKLHSLVRYLGVSDGNMQEGSFRCDANVSIRPEGQEEFGTRAELKNINSFRFVEKAIHYEVDRQIEILEDGGEVVQETRLYDADRNETRSMRSKEEAHDYRYFPDPDLPPMVLDDAFIESVRSSLPELPQERQQRFVREFGLNTQDASQLTGDRALADYFETLQSMTNVSPKVACNWVLGELNAALNQSELEISETLVNTGQLAELLDRVEDGTISGKIAKEVFGAMWNGEGSADEIIEAKGLKQITDSSEIEEIVVQVISESKDQVAQYTDGNQKVIGYFVGQIMKRTGGKANPQQVNKILRDKLDQ